MKKQWRMHCLFRCSLAAVLLVTLIFASSCGSQTAPLTAESLKNAEYQGIYPQPIELSDGQYEGEPFVEGAASRPTVTFMEPYALGDLDGDGVEDAAVLLVESSGGSGSFVYLAAVLNRDGTPQNTATTLLGDRTQVEGLTIESGQIGLKVLTHGPDDPMCCPSQESEETYVLEGGQLQQQGTSP
ncbi:MAG: hypothetical protein ACK2U2_05975 [Anaerolineae bacterium]|jgi:hypothetical protein